MVTNVCTTVPQLLEKLAREGRYSAENLEKIKKAGEYAEELHEGQFRICGDPYISHPVAVADMVSDLGVGVEATCAALLHDTVEDCSDKTDLKEIEKRFGADVARLVDGLTKLPLLHVEDKEEAQLENLRKMVLAMSKDLKVIFIKLCDRLHNIRTLDAKPEAKRRSTALETMHIYAPLAHRLGMRKLKHELEDRCIAYLDPIGYAEVERFKAEMCAKHEKKFTKVQDEIRKRLAENNIDFELSGRIKTGYSIYNKMYGKFKTFDEIYDFYAMRVIVETELECYATLGIVHEMFSPLDGRFKDYISSPKSNMYQAIHTTVIGSDGIPFEVQIRTREMHHIAEYGVCAHWKYKNGNTSAKVQDNIEKRLGWISSLIETSNTTNDSEEFMSALKTNIFQDEIYVFTPKGETIILGKGDTVIDFAYAIHSGVGNSMIGAKVNGAIVPIDKEPQAGDIIEIITSSSSKGPSRDWLKIAKSTSARSKIRSFFKKERRAENIVEGKNIIDAEFKRFAPSSTEQQRIETVTATSQRMGYMTADDLYNDLGYGGISYSKIETKLRDEYDRSFGKKEDAEQGNELTVEQVKLSTSKNINSNGGVIVDGLEGCLVKFAKCCRPLPGDDIVGFITRGHGVSVHSADCPNIELSRSNVENKDRWVNVHWAEVKERSSALYEAQMGITVFDRSGILADIIAVFSDMKVQLLQINTSNINENDVLINLKISCKNVEHYNSIVSRLRTIEGVKDIRR